MKRFIAILLVIQFLLLTGCTIPFFGKRSEQLPEITEDQGMLKIPEDGQMNSTGNSISDSFSKDKTSGVANGVTNGATNGVTSGATNDAVNGATNGVTSGATNDAANGATNSAANGATNDAANGATNGVTSGATNDAVNGAANGVTSGATNDAANGATNGATDGALSQANSGTAAGAVVPPAPTGVLDSATASSISSETAGSGVDSTQLEQANGDTGVDLSAVSEAEGLSDAGTVFAEARQPVTVYYQDGDGYLIPMTRWIQKQQGIARAAVSLNIDSAITREEVAYYGVYPVIPVNTDILGIDIKDGIATIDFDNHLLNYSNAASERNIIASIVYTLTEFRTISKVLILINGYPQGILKYGTDVSGALGREDIAINADASVISDGSGKVDVFLFKKANVGFTYLVPVSVVYSESAGELPEILVKQLLGKNTIDSLYTEMPDGVDLLKCSMSNDILTLDFSESFIDYGGNAREEGILKQLAYTIRQVEGIKRLRILVGGQKVELPEGSDIYAGLAIPATINDVMDR